MASIIRSFIIKFFAFFVLLLHLGCFVFSATDTQNRRERPNKKRKNSPVSRFKPHKAISSSWSYVKRIFSRTKTYNDQQPSTPTLSSARSSQRSIVNNNPLLPVLPESILSAETPPHEVVSDTFPDDNNNSSSSFIFPLRNDIIPCTACGEVFQKPQLLEQHLAIKHAVSELIGDDSGRNIVKIIFKTGWTDKEKSPKIDRILKIHNSPKILSRFEEYRESVKAKAASRNATAVRRRDERCIADGNELLRFHCSTFMCDLGLDGNSSLCNQQYCSVCGIVRAGFSPKLDGLSTLSTSWRAHLAIPEDIVEEFRFMNVKRAMLVCRVIAGRVGCDMDDVDKEDGGGCDSVIGRGGSGACTRLDEEELLVFNPRAVLPCFVIVYSV